MSEKNHSHVAVHAIQYLDKDGNTKTIKAKTSFAPADHNLDADTVKSLSDRGAIKKLDRKEAAAAPKADDKAGAAGNAGKQ